VIGEQRVQFQALVDEWKRRIKEVPGWEEDRSEVPVPEGYTLWCYMKDYRWLRGLGINDLIIANPNVTIGIRTYQAKSHLNRFIGVIEDLDPGIFNAYEAVRRICERLADTHTGRGYSISLKSLGGLPMKSYATESPMTQEVDLEIGASIPDDHLKEEYLTLGLRTPFHTVCPFMIYEADGHSHSQRTYLQCRITVPVSGLLDPNILDFHPIMAELNTRMTPGQSRMKIPDEAVHCLRAYSTPTYTEWGALQFMAVIRDTKKQWFKYPDRLAHVRVEVLSVESIFANDIHSTCEASF
jgi:GTP cyclohydrolase FolE2